MISHLFSFVLVLSVVLADLTLTSDGCVDPDGFTTCMNKATDHAKSLLEQFCDPNTSACDGVDNCSANDKRCQQAVICPAYGNWLVCGATFCWNKGYSCEFQNLEITAIESCPSLSMVYGPYFPAPDNIPGACSCRILDVYAYISGSQPLVNHCQTHVSTINMQGSSTNLGTDCNCCGASRGVSMLPSFCPATDPTQIPFWSTDTLLQDFASQLTGQACSNVFSKGIDCAEPPLNFSMPSGGRFFNEDTLPTPGTDALSNSAGYLTAPLAPVVTWPVWVGGPTWKITAAVGNGGSSSSSTSSSLAPVTTTSSSFTSTSSSSTSSTSSAAAIPTTRDVLLGSLAGLVAVLAL